MEETGIPALQAVLVWGGAFTVLAGVGTVLWRLGRAVARTVARAEQFMDDWYGEPERPGVEARPGMMQRVAEIESRLGGVEHELHPNDGGSLRDAVDQANMRLVHLCPDDPQRPPSTLPE
ncbi:hypothetical protein ACLQ2N_16005 [Streptomyces sp. DT224]|uniref:hypothetical protein n=1 Tax=Streptomyces sp. DT224 TaxID=3393426 RepID=UPI003CF2693D